MSQADQVIRKLEDTTRDLSHTIVHVDMDAFYAAVEMRDEPSLKDKPMAVGSMSMLSTSNYVARRYGIRAAMPGFIAKKLCPELVIIPLNFDKYIAVSKEVRRIFAEYDPNFVCASLDEAYLDLTEHLSKRMNSPTSSRTFLLRNSVTEDSSQCQCDLNLMLRHLVLQEIQNDIQALNSSEVFDARNKFEGFKICSLCKRDFPPFTLKVYGVSDEEAVIEMRNRIEQRTKLTASAGIAPNTMLAKVCSDKNKPNGQFKVGSSKQLIEKFISDLPVRKIPGIGKVTEKLLEALGVISCQDLYKHRAILYHVFSEKSFNYFMCIALGIGSSTVERNGEKKSVSTEQTFGDIDNLEELLAKCQELCHCLAEDLQKEKLLGKAVTLKIKTVDFKVKTRTCTISTYSSDVKTIFNAAKHMLETEMSEQKPDCLRLRLMGVRMSKLISQAGNNSSFISSFFDKHKIKNIKRDESVIESTSSKGKERKNLYYTEIGNTTSPLPDYSSNQPVISTATPCTDSLFDYDNDLTFFQQGQDDDQEDIDESESSKLLHTEAEISMGNKSKHHQTNHQAKKQRTISDLFQNGNNNTGQNQDVASKLLNCAADLNATDNLQQENTCTETEKFRDNFYTCSSHNSLLLEDSSVAADAHRHIDPPASKSDKKFPSVSAVSVDLLLPGMIQCPVCGQQKYQWPLDQLNTHMDLCLSRSTVKDILVDQQHQHSTVSKKRLREEDETKQSDKLERNQRTLLSFFKS